MDKSDTLIYGAEFMDDTLNPMLDSQDCGPMLYRGLMRTDEDCNPQCDLATDYQVSDDLLEYTFTLRDGVKFHDGTDLTVEDVIFTIKTVMEDQTNSALREDFSLVDKVEKVDDATLKITLKEPFPALLDKRPSVSSPPTASRRGRISTPPPSTRTPWAAAPTGSSAMRPTPSWY